MSVFSNEHDPKMLGFPSRPRRFVAEERLRKPSRVQSQQARRRCKGNLAFGKMRPKITIFMGAKINHPLKR